MNFNDQPLFSSRNSNSNQPVFGGSVQFSERSEPYFEKNECYTLFPPKKKKGRNKKSPEKTIVPTNLRVENRPSFRIIPRGSAIQQSLTGKPTQQFTSETISDEKWPCLDNNLKPSDSKFENDRMIHRSFADMVKNPSRPIQSQDRNSNAEPDTKMPSDCGVKCAKVKQITYSKNAAISSIMKTKQPIPKVVLNQISASTYGTIGKSDDESKYVMNKVNTNSEIIKPRVVRHEIEVEFLEPEAKYFSSDDDFEVEFNANALPRQSQNAVNKISANTFQQIGKTLDTEKYVMKPKLWSSVVGKSLKPSSDYNRNQIRRNETEDQVEQKGEPNPTDLIRAKLKDGVELTAEEREKLRQKRRERRKKEKENKRKAREEEQRRDLMKPQTTKLNFISSNILQQVQGVTGKASQSSSRKNKEIKFMDEEYPEIKQKPKLSYSRGVVISTEIRDENGRLTSDRESNSEWETEDESKESNVQITDNDNNELIVEVISNPVPVSYSSILKTERKQEILKPTSVEKPPSEECSTEKPVEKKKVKKKDPIALDLFSALHKKKPQLSKSTSVLSSKVKKEPVVKSVRNQLDSSAPSIKRGKEREGGKKKRKTLMKKIILADREKRKIARENAEKRREERIKSGVILKPLIPKDDENDTITDSNGNENINAKKDIAFLGTDSEEKPSLDVPDNTGPSVMSTKDKALVAIHSRKFRSYCSHILSSELDSFVTLMMGDLVRFQDKQHAKDPVKAKAKRRYVVGLREVAKFLKVRKVTCVIFAPDIERVESEGGLDDAVTTLIKDAEAMNVSTIFSLNRRKLGKICIKKVPVSCIGIMNYQGSDENYKSIQCLAERLREEYKDKLESEIERIENPNSNHNTYSVRSSVLSSQAAEFVPSSAAVDCSAGLYDYYSQDYYEYYNGYYNGNYYSNSGYGYDQPWQNMLNILKN